MILVFDLDDTLYNELSFVKSGFLAVSKYVYEVYSIPIKQSLKFMEKKLKNGRGKIFDDLLINYGIYNKRTVRKCVSVYRQHTPNIKLYPEAKDCLRKFKDYPIYIVTDGNKIVQKNKIIALGLNNKVKSFILTSNYGLKNSKPSPYCFLHICKKEKVKPRQVVYIADNPSKDFFGIKPLGFKTIRLMKNKFKNSKVPQKYEADYKINNLKSLTKEFIIQLSN